MKQLHQIKKDFLDACINNDLKKVNNLLNSENEFIHNVLYQENFTNNPLAECAKFGNLEMIKYLTSSPELKEPFDISKNYKQIFDEACYSENIHIIDYLLNDVKPDYYNYQVLCSTGIQLAVSEGSLNTIFRRLPNRHQNEYDIQVENEFIIEAACEYNYLNIVQYIFNEPKLENYQNNIEILEKGLGLAIQKQNLEIAKFFIFDLNAQKNDDIEKIIQINLPIEIQEKINSYFHIKNLNKSLNEELNSQFDNRSNNKKPKV